MNAIFPTTRAQERDSDRELFRISAILSALECLMKYDSDVDLRKHVRRRYLDMSDKLNVADMEKRRGR